MSMRMSLLVMMTSIVGLALVLQLITEATAQRNVASSVPLSVQLYEQHKKIMPVSNFNLSLKKLLARSEKDFYALPSDVCEGECDAGLEDVIVAYGGWCAAGIEDEKGPHFSQAIFPRVKIRQYGNKTVVYVNHYLKSFSEASEDDIAAAERFLAAPEKFPSMLRDVRGRKFQLFAVEYASEFIPLKRTLP